MNVASKKVMQIGSGSLVLQQEPEPHQSRCKNNLYWVNKRILRAQQRFISPIYIGFSVASCLQ